MKSENYVTVLAILNAMATRIANSLPQIEEATRGLQHDFGAGNGVRTDGPADANV